MKKFLWFFVFLGLIGSCKEDPICPVCPKEEKFHSPLGAVHYENPAQAFIGFGYDLTGNYADISYKRGRVFEVLKLPENWTDSVVDPKTIITIVSGETVSEYQEQVSNSIEIEGKYKLFSGSLRINFDQSYYQLNKTSFATVQSKINRFNYNVIDNHATAEELRPFMDSTAVRDLNDDTKSPEWIFNKYGTHVITGVIMGGRLDFSTTMLSSLNKTGRSIHELAEADYGWATGDVNAKQSYSDSIQRKQFHEYRKVTLTARGGFYDNLPLVKSDGSINQFANSYKEWVKSLNISNYSITDFKQKNGLIAIWEFVKSKNTNRRKALKDYFDVYLANSQIKTYDHPIPARPCIIDVIVQSSGNDNLPDQVTHNGKNYTKIPSDLNRNAGGSYIYLYVLYGMDTDEIPLKPITRFYIYSHHKKTDARFTNLPGYELIDNDLNEGAEGDFIYLYKSRETRLIVRNPFNHQIDTMYYPPIRGIRVYNHDWKDNNYKYSDDNLLTGYFDVSGTHYPQDLNRNAGGDLIYLQYSRD